MGTREQDLLRRIDEQLSPTTPTIHLPQFGKEPSLSGDVDAGRGQQERERVLLDRIDAASTSHEFPGGGGQAEAAPTPASPMPTGVALGDRVGRAAAAQIEPDVAPIRGAVLPSTSPWDRPTPAAPAHPFSPAGMLEPGNIDLAKRPVVHNPDGSISTVRSMSIGTDKGEVLLPTISPDGRELSDQEAVDLFHQTGQHLGRFADPASATTYAQALHEQQRRTYAPPAAAPELPGAAPAPDTVTPTPRAGEGQQYDELKRLRDSLARSLEMGAGKHFSSEFEQRTRAALARAEAALATHERAQPPAPTTDPVAQRIAGPGVNPSVSPQEAARITSQPAREPDLLEREATTLQQLGPKASAKAAGGAVAREFAGTVASGVQALPIAESAIGMTDKPVQEHGLYRYGQAMRDEANGLFPEDPRAQDSYLLSKLPSAVGGTLPFMALGVAGKPLSMLLEGAGMTEAAAATAAHTALSAPLLAAGGAVAGYQNAIKSGKGEDAAVHAAELHALPALAFTVPVVKLIGRTAPHALGPIASALAEAGGARGAGRVAGALVGQSIEGALDFGIASAVAKAGSDGVEKALGESDPTLAQGFKDAVDAGGEGMGVGFLLSFMTGALGLPQLQDQAGVRGLPAVSTGNRSPFERSVDDRGNVTYKVNPYGVIGVSPAASDAEVDRVFRERMSAVHPDRNPGDPSATAAASALNAARDAIKQERASEVPVDQLMQQTRATAGVPEPAAPPVAGQTMAPAEPAGPPPPRQEREPIGAYETPPPAPVAAPPGPEAPAPAAEMPPPASTPEQRAQLEVQRNLRLMRDAGQPMPDGDAIGQMFHRAYEQEISVRGLPPEAAAPRDAQVLAGIDGALEPEAPVVARNDVAQQEPVSKEAPAAPEKPATPAPATSSPEVIKPPQAGASLEELRNSVAQQPKQPEVGAQVRIGAHALDALKEDGSLPPDWNQSDKLSVVEVYPNTKAALVRDEYGMEHDVDLSALEPVRPEIEAEQAGQPNMFAEQTPATVERPSNEGQVKVEKAAAAPKEGLTVRDFEGRVGERDHMTRTERGTIPTSAIANLGGAKGEVPGDHRNRKGPAWEAFKQDIAENGIKNPITISVDPGEPPKIIEGNHRRDAAVELGLKDVPVDIRYFGHAEREGAVTERPAAAAAPKPDKAKLVPKRTEGGGVQYVAEPVETPAPTGGPPTTVDQKVELGLTQKAIELLHKARYEGEQKVTEKTLAAWKDLRKKGLARVENRKDGAYASAVSKADYEAARQPAPSGSVRPEPAPAGEPRPEPEAAGKAQEEPAAEETAPKAKKRVVSDDEYADVLKQLKAKLNELRTGIDPDMWRLGTKVAMYHLERTPERFMDFAHRMSELLGKSVKELRPYLRKWYNGARDDMEEAGQDVSGMDSPEAVRDAISDIDALPAEEKSNAQPDRGGVPAAAPEEPAGEPAGRAPAADQQRRAPVVPAADRGAGGEPVQAGGEGPARGEGAVEQGAGGEERAGDRESGDRVGAGQGDRDRAAAGRLRRVDYRITEADELGKGGIKGKAKGNLDAIRLLKAIEAEGRPATVDEQAQLVKYVGWGGIPQAFDERNADFANVAKDLKGLLTDDEYRAARASTPNAHYTSQTVVEQIHAALERMGIRDLTAPRLLEPSAGVGHFLGLTPKGEGARWTAVELDSITGRIAALLYPNQDVRVQGFETVVAPDDSFDVAVGNVPFGDYPIHDPRYDKTVTANIHDYFFAKSLDKVRPGGVVAFITSRYTMDKRNNTVRRYLAERADLIGAIRLPQTAFEKNANTQVVTDIIFLRKRSPGEPLGDEGWLNTVNARDTQVNKYFRDNPKMILGNETFAGTMYRGEEYTVEASGDLQKQLAAAIARLPENVIKGRQAAQATALAAMDAPAGLQEGSLTVAGGDVMVSHMGKLIPADIAKAQQPRVKQFIKIRDAARNLTTAEMHDRPEAEIEGFRKVLNREYDAFVKAFGPINKEVTTVGPSGAVTVRRPNYQPYRLDPEAPRAAALEVYDAEKGTAAKAPLLLERQIRPPRARIQAKNTIEALPFSLADKGKIDLGYIASLIGQTEEQVKKGLEGLAYEDPETGTWLASDEYLSGDVRRRLAIARAAAKRDVRFTPHVEALEKVIPEDLKPSEIHAALGSAWIPTKDIEQFIRDTFETPRSSMKVEYVQTMGAWVVDAPSAQNSVRAQSELGTPRKNAVDLIEDSLNQRPSIVWDTDEDGKRVKNAQATMAARAAQDRLQELFKEWVWKDPARGERLARKYNDEFNNLRARVYKTPHEPVKGEDGKPGWTLPGMSSRILLREHQANGAWRVMASGNTLLAHVVGAGKTWTMQAAGMEARRTGMANRPLYVVPNHMLEQFSNEFIQLYPGARLLVAQKEDFEKGARQIFTAKVSSGDWDGVVMTHSMYGRVPMSAEFQTRYINQQVDRLRAAMEEAAQEGKGSKAGRNAVKAIEKAIEKYEVRLKDLENRKVKDRALSFEELGVDMLFVDEAHLFKNLETITKIQGLPTSASQRATDMHMKTRYLEQINPGRGIVFATGTPVANSITEAHVMMRYLQGPTLEAMGLEHFDAWAGTFGQYVTDLEVAPDGSGFRMNTRFARFSNVPELSGMLRQRWDVQTADMLNLPRPKLEGGKADAVVIPSHQALKDYVASLVKRSEAVKAKRVDPREDNMLKITGDGRRAALDMRLVDRAYEALPDEDSKVNQAAKNIYAIWKQTEAQRLTQLAFIDTSTPKDDGHDAYHWLKDALLARGVPASDIAFMHDADTDTKKARLFADVRAGKVRILLGSTEKMGVGTNVQKLLYAKHDLDAPWRPADIEQRDGRILRQGNENPEVRILRYIQEGSFDAYMWQGLERKEGFIRQLMKGDIGVREIEDVDGMTLNAAEIKALATGNPKIMEKAKLDAEVAKLQAVKKSYLDSQYQARASLSGLPIREKELVAEIADFEVDAAKVEDTSGDKFTVTILDKTLTDRKEAGDAMVEAVKKALAVAKGARVKIAEFAGFPVRVETPQDISILTRPALVLAGKRTYQTDIGGIETKFGDKGVGLDWVTDDLSPAGLVMRLERLAEQPEKALTKAQVDLERNRARQEEYAASLGKPFPQEDRLQAAVLRQRQLNDELNLDKQKEQAADAGDEGGDEGDGDESTLDRMEREARERIDQRGEQRYGGGPSDEDIVDYAIIGAAKLVRGTRSIVAWSRAMVDEFGSAIRPRLKEIRATALKIARGKKVDLSALPADRRARAEAAIAKLRQGRTVAPGEVGLERPRSQLPPANAREKRLLRQRAERDKLERQRRKLADIGARIGAAPALSDKLAARAQRAVEASLVPAQAREIMDMVRRAKDPAAAARAIKRAETILKDQLRQKAAADLKSQLQRALKKGKQIRPEFLKDVVIAATDVDLQSFPPGLRNALARTAKYLADHPETHIAEPVRDAMADLDPAKLARMEPDRITEIADAVRSAIFSSRNANRMLGVARKQTIDEAAALISKQAAGRRALPMKMVGGLEAAPRRGTISGYFREQSTRPEIIAEGMSEELRRIFWEDMVDAFSRQEGYRHEIEDGIREAVRAAGELAGRDFVRADRSAGSAWTKEFDDWMKEPLDFEDAKGQQVQLARHELWSLLAEMHAPENWAIRMGEPEANKIARSGRYFSLDDAAVERLKALATPADNAMAYGAFKSFNGPMKRMVNRASTRTVGREVMTVPDYMPQNFDPDSKNTGADPMEAFAKDVTASVASWGHLKARKGGAKVLDVNNLMDTWLNHARHVSRIAAFWGPANNFKAVMGRENVKRAIRAAGGDIAYERLVDAVNLQTVPVVDKTEMLKRLRVGIRLNQGAILAMRIGSPFKHFAGLFVAAGYQPRGFSYIGQATASLTPAEIKRIDRDATEASPYWRTRFEGGFVHEVMSGMGTARQRSFGRRGIMDRLMTPMQKSDHLRNVISWRTAELEVQRNSPQLEPGTSAFKQAAAAKWLRLALRSDNTSVGVEMSGLLAAGRRHPVAAAIYYFGSGPSKVYSLPVRAYDQAGRGDHAGAARSLAAFGASVAALAMIAEAMRKLRSKKDENTQPVAAFLSEAASTIPIVGPNFIAPMVRKLAGMPAQAYPASALDEWMIQAFAAGSEVVTAWNQYTADQLNGKGEAVWTATLKRAAERIMDLTASGALDLWKIGEHVADMAGAIPADAPADLRAGLRALDKQGDVTQERRHLFRAIGDDDPKEFRAAIEAMKAKGEHVDAPEVAATIDRRFAYLTKYEEGKPDRAKLSEALQAQVDEQLAERDELRKMAAQLVHENRDVLDRSRARPTRPLQRQRPLR